MARLTQSGVKTGEGDSPGYCSPRPLHDTWLLSRVCITHMHPQTLTSMCTQILEHCKVVVNKLRQWQFVQHLSTGSFLLRKQCEITNTSNKMGSWQQLQTTFHITTPVIVYDAQTQLSYGSDPASDCFTLTSKVCVILFHREEQ